MERKSRPAERSIALVTGAAQGIGRGIAQSLAETSYRVMLADIEDALLEEATAGLKARGYDAVALHLEVGSQRDWESAIGALNAKWGGLDVLVNCAGISPRGTVESTSEAALGANAFDQPEGAMAGDQGCAAVFAGTAGDDREHRLDAGDAADARTLLVYCEQGGPVGTDAAGGGRVHERVDHVQHDRTGVGRHAERAIDPGEIRPAGLSRGDSQPHDAGGNRRGRRVPGLTALEAAKINGVILYMDGGLQIADDAGMVYLPDRVRPPYEQRIEES